MVTLLKYSIIIFIICSALILLLNHFTKKKWGRILGRRPTREELVIIIDLESIKYPQDEIAEILKKFNANLIDKKTISELIKNKRRELKQKIVDEVATKNKARELKFKAKQQEFQNKLREIETQKQALKNQNYDISVVPTDEIMEAEIIQEYPDETPVEIIDFYERREFDAMRFALQKIAYEMVGDKHSQQEKDKFKKIMTYFAYKDPLYNDCIKKIIGIVAKNEGMLQTQIYQYFKEYDTEIMRYVLYFGGELGDIRRVKSGRSYKLYTSI